MSLVLSSSLVTPALQGFVFSLQMGPGQLFSVGNNWYFVTIAQVGIAEDTNLVSVYKSSDILAWNLVSTLPAATPPAVNSVAQDCPIIQSGTNLYIIGIVNNGSFSPQHVNLQVHKFDTTTDTFSNSSLGPNQSGAGQMLWSISEQNNGTLLISSTIGPPAFAVQFGYQTYDPTFDTWSAFVQIQNNASRVVQQVHDTGTDFTYIYYVTPTNQLRCYSIDPATSNNDTLITTSFFPTANIGTGLVSSATNQVVLTYRKFVSGVSTLFAVRSDLTNPPAFTTDTVQNGAGLPVGTQIQQYDQIASGGWFPVDINGTLYIFYTVDNGELDSGSSQSFLYYQSETAPGTWSSPTLVYTSPVPAEMLTPYAAVNSQGVVVVMLGLIDPTLFPAYASLSNVVLFSGLPTPNLPFVYIANAFPVILPDPSKMGCS
jgi:hypothetical protein